MKEYTSVKQGSNEVSVLKKINELAKRNWEVVPLILADGSILMERKASRPERVEQPSPTLRSRNRRR